MNKPAIILCGGEQNTNLRPGKIEWICIHYTAGASSKAGTAKQNAEYYNSGYRGASADFFVDEGSIVQKTPDIRRYYTWAVGGYPLNTQGHRYYGICMNKNSVSIEMCSFNDTGKVTSSPNDGHWHVKDSVVAQTVALTRWLMEELGIPADHVIRHYDVTGKLCPGIVGWNEDSGDVSAWRDFQAKISAGTASETQKPQQQRQEDDDMITNEQFKALMEAYRAELRDNDASLYSKEAREWAVKNKLFQGGGGDANFMWEDFLTREQLATLLYRFSKLQG